VVLTRREVLLGAAGAAAAFAKKPAPPPPNVLLITAGGLGAWMLGCYGNRDIRTPNIDLLARTGTRFLNHVAAAPSPAEGMASLLAGRAPASAPAARFISDMLAAKGYMCGYSGRWNIGDGVQPRNGFKFWYTLPEQPVSYEDPTMSRNGSIVREKGFLPEIITRGALEFLDARKPGEPFFLVVSYTGPGEGYEGLPAKYTSMYAPAEMLDIGWRPEAENAVRGKDAFTDIFGSLRKCAAAVTALDDQVPPLLKKLDERKLRDNTIIVFTSPSGFLMGRHGLWGDGRASDPPNMFEESVETPMIWSWLGKTPPEAVRPEVVGADDLLPTLSEALALPAPKGAGLCGQSYLPAVTGDPFPKKRPWTNIAFSRFGDTEMVRDTRYKLVMRAGGKGPNELYDLTKDDRETTNLFDNESFISVRDYLTGKLNEWRKGCAA
jgi:arylsulfatase A-like enzyme